MNEAGTWQHLYAELRRRKVFRVATIYVITLWPLIQLADILQPALGYSDGVLRAMLYLFIGGFPVALTLAWLYDITHEGIVRTPEQPDAAPARPLLNRTAEALIIGALAVLVITLFAIKMSLDNESSTAATPPQAKVQVQPAASVASIAVLPFTSFSTVEDDQVFADGLTEELLNQLARVRELRVAARTSSFAYKGVNRNVQEVGRELGVGTILEGSVRRSDVSATIRITAQLVDVASGTHLWSKTYDREYRDVLRIQDEIAAAVAEHLSVTLLGAREGEAVQRGAASPEALILVSRGRAGLARRSGKAITEAIGQLEAGILASPDWAEAHASLAEACVLSVLYADTNREEFLAKAQQAVEVALRLDARLGAAWASQGLIHMQYPERRSQAIEALNRAIELNPSYSMAYMWLGSLQQDPQQTLHFHRKALELDPRSAVAAYNVAHDLLVAGREDEAMEVFGTIVAADPFYPGAYQLTAQINELHGRLDEAAMDYRRAWDLEHDGGTAASIAKLYATLGDTAGARRWIERAGSTEDPLKQLGVMWVHAMLAHTEGDAEGSRQWIERIARNAAPHGEIGALMSAFAWGVIERHDLAVAGFDKNPSLAQEGGFKLSGTDLTDAWLVAVRSYRAVGRASDADRVLTQVRTQIDQRIAAGGRIDPHLWYQRAQLHVLEGDPRMALALLRRAIDEGWTEAWRLAVDPLWNGLRSDAQFERIGRDLQARLQVMRENLARETASDS